jgi:hypothetical protein
VGTALADLAAAEQVMASPDNRPVVY